MEREPTFQRPPRGTVSLQNPDEAGESHWHRKQKKVSVSVDRRVVGYLRKRLNRRLEERVQALLAESDSEEENTSRKPGIYKDKKKHAQNGKTSKSPEDTKIERMFSKYTETGEIVTPSPDHVKKPAKSTRFKEEVTINGHVVNNENVSETLLDISMNPKTPVLPKIQSPTPNLSKADTDKEVDEGIKTSESEEEQDLLAQLGKITEEEIFEGFRDVVVSPVQTPVLQRPLTREQTRLEMRDRISEILRGHIQRACPCNNKVLRMYVCADFSDTVSERTYLIEKTYPHLRMCCLERGYDLEIYDLHWGIPDSSTDDHSLPDICLKFLEQSINSPTGTNCLVLLGEKFGQYLLPRVIPPDDFNTIYTTAKHNRKRQVDDLNEKIAKVEKTSEDREQRRQQLEPENSDLEAIEQAFLSGLEEELNIEVRKNSSNKLRTNAEIVKREQQVVKSLKDKRDAMPSPELLINWYKLDENLNPPMYKLQNISTNIKEYTKGDAKRREAARLTWRDAALKLRSLFDEFADVVVADDTSKRHYFTSLFSREIESGFIENIHGDEQIVVVQRTITDIRVHLHEAVMSDYTDLHPQHRRQATVQLDYLNNIKEDIIPERIPQANVLPYEIEWAQGGILQSHRPHQVYLERMSKQTTETLRRQVLRSLIENEESRDQSQILFEEVSQHVLLCHEKGRQFQGRKDLLQLIKSYLRSPCRNPLVLYGKAGSGKTAVVSKVTKEIQKWIKGQSTAVLFRSVGLTTLSTNVRTLLRNLCLQLCYVFEGNTDDVPYEYKALVNFFNQICSLATSTQPLVIVLDALDCLSGTFVDKYNC
ncbi:hypothetical protein FSP39_006946 [Pinctada imbricata]|uniref:Orc1-like AAA ATPase domain-containing protein n=1 Tax=Pinctada imbricata TaxID=66713 RepID=A0AA88YAT4_PINIB|nr:hypothetical protein FSP39_006946 [Pinctada imbricata]